MLIGRVVNRPSWMLAGINTVKLAIVYCDIVQVTGARNELHHLDDLTCLGVVFDQAGCVPLVSAGPFLLVPVYLPDEAIIIGNTVQPFRQAR